MKSTVPVVVVMVAVVAAPAVVVVVVVVVVVGEGRKRDRGSHVRISHVNKTGRNSDWTNRTTFPILNVCISVITVHGQGIAASRKTDQSHNAMTVASKVVVCGLEI